MSRPGRPHRAAPPVVPLTPGEQALLRAVQNDPVFFCRAFLGFEPWEMQAQIMRAVADHDRVAVASGHKIGKSLLAAALALWFCVTRPEGRVIMTAAIGRQVEKILWREVKTLHHKADARGTPLGGKLALTPDNGLVFPDGREIFGFATDEKERMAGYSGQNVLFIADEASGIKEGIFEAIEGNRAGGAKLLMMSNPTQPAGTFFDAFHSKRSRYKTFQVSSETTPNAVSGQRLVPGLATAEFIAEKREEWGEDSPLYKVRIKGEFADQAENSLVTLSSLMMAIARFEVDPITDDDVTLKGGLDVAREGGDDNILIGRRGRRVPRLPLLLTPGDGKVIADQAVAAMNALMNDSERADPASVALFVDATGVGWSPVDFLKRHPLRHFRVIPVQTGSKSLVMSEGGFPKYANLRAEAWFSLAEWSKYAILPDGDGKLQEELVDVRYQITDRNQMKIEDKNKSKQRLGRSPDRGDALMLTFVPDKGFRVRAQRSAGDAVLASF